jgi:hypothetical protein
MEISTADWIQSSGEIHIGMKCGPNDNPGCCWWGRGPTQITGVHNYKVLDNWLKNKLGNDYDLCNHPDNICKDSFVVWLSALSYWCNSVQTESQYSIQLSDYAKRSSAFLKLEDGEKVEVVFDSF